MDGHFSDYLVIGAGMAGLACATELSRSGARVTILDKGRGPGGRMATRRAEIGGASIGFDHGAQYFTVRDPAFGGVVERWEQAGVAARWPAAGEDAWVGVPGMNAPIRAMAEPLDVRWGLRAASLQREGARWRVETESGAFTAGRVLVAVPAEQAAVMLAEVVPDFAALASRVVSAPCWAAMAAFAKRLPIADDCIRADSGPITWAARNSAKPGRSGAETWVIHASPERSRELLAAAKEDAGSALLADFFTAAGIPPVAALHCDAHRWLYALPEALEGMGAIFDPALGIGVAGDWLHSPRIEGAWLSGRALAELVLG